MRSKGFKYTDDEVKAFVDNVYAIMGKNSFGTQEAFAARIGVSDGTLRKYLNGRIETIQYATVREICKVGHMSEKELFGETRSSEELEIVEKLDFCSKFLKKGDKEFITINEQITKIAQNHPAIVKTSSSEAPCWISR